MSEVKAIKLEHGKAYRTKDFDVVVVTKNNLVDASPLLDPYEAFGRAFSIDEKKPKKFFIIGHGRHGKDTLADIIARDLNMTFQSSSLFALDKVILPYVMENPSSTLAKKVAGVPDHEKRQALFDRRADCRDEWKQLICNYNLPVRYRLAEELFSEFDIYVGIRSRIEYESVLEHLSPKYDISSIFVSYHSRPREESLTVPMHMADVVIENSGKYEDLLRNYLEVKDMFGWTAK